MLVGHSDGASIALIHAAQHPVSAVVAIAPHVFVEDMCLAEIRKAKRRLQGRRPARADGPPPPRPRRRVLRLERRLAAPASSREWDITDELREVTPAAADPGERDQYGTMAQLDAIEQAAQGPGRPASTWTASTPPRPSSPSETAEAIADFLSRSAARR